MSSEHIPVSLQRRVRIRAADRCEYCRIAQANQEATFHVDHIVPRASGGKTAIDNLPLACVSCSLRKGARTSAVDPDTGEATGIFHPRLHRWDEHFGFDTSCEIAGRTTIGRATVVLLRLNVRSQSQFAAKNAFATGGLCTFEDFAGTVCKIWSFTRSPRRSANKFERSDSNLSR
jgi:hypothetical protein